MHTTLAHLLGYGVRALAPFPTLCVGARQLLDNATVDLAPLAAQYGLPLGHLVNQRALGLDRPAYRLRRDAAFFAWAHAMAPHLQGCSWLDVGANVGAVSVYLAARWGSTRFALCDTVVHPQANYPITRMDGSHLEYDDQSFDVVLLSYVLHHAADHTLQLLRDAGRIARQYVVVLEDPKETAADARWAAAHDRAGTFRGLREWRDLFQLLRLTVVHEAALDGEPHSRHLFVLTPPQPPPT